MASETKNTAVVPDPVPESDPVPPTHHKGLPVLPVRDTVLFPHAVLPLRSEERRVGKECRSGWALQHESKKVEKANDRHVISNNVCVMVKPMIASTS